MLQVDVDDVTRVHEMDSGPSHAALRSASSPSNAADARQRRTSMGDFIRASALGKAVAHRFSPAAKSGPAKERRDSRVVHRRHLSMEVGNMQDAESDYHSKAGAGRLEGRQVGFW
jgi:hypothetical protein